MSPRGKGNDDRECPVTKRVPGRSFSRCSITLRGSKTFKGCPVVQRGPVTFDRVRLGLCFRIADAEEKQQVHRKSSTCGSNSFFCKYSFFLWFSTVSRSLNSDIREGEWPATATASRIVSRNCFATGFALENTVNGPKRDYPRSRFPLSFSFSFSPLTTSRGNDDRPVSPRFTFLFSGKLCRTMKFSSTRVG